MFCTKCGIELRDSDQYCSQCGRAVRSGSAELSQPPVLSRPVDQKKIAGVCAGFARYFDVDVTLMRIIWLAVICLSGGLGILIYLAAWLIMPKDYPVAAARPQTAVQPGTI